MTTMPNDTLPEWAERGAKRVYAELLNEMNDDEERIIARALVAAHDRGLQRGADSNDTLIESLEEGLMTDADLSKSDRMAMQYQIMALTEASDAIRKLMESSNEN